MEDDKDTTTKLVILVLGISTFALFAYLICRSMREPTYSDPMRERRYGFMGENENEKLQSLEQKLASLENKVDSILMTQENNFSRNTVSMIQGNGKSTPEIFGMI